MTTGEVQENKEQERTPIKAGIFDLDGLLIDSEPYWEKGDRLLLGQLGVTVSSKQDKWIRQKMLGRGQQGCAQIYIKEFKLKETIESFIQKRWECLYSLLLDDLRLMPGAKNLIQRLTGKNLILVLATGGHLKEKALEILEKLAISHFFQLIVSSLDVKRSKPFPDIYLACAKRLKLDPSECLALEDAPNGVLAAKAAGMFTIGVNSSGKVREELKKAGADKVFVSLGDIEL